MFKEKLKELRRKKGLSQQELADKIYVSRSAICKWEMGNGVPSEINIEALCTFFEVDEEWLFDREDLKEGIKITKRNHNVNIANIILIVLTFIFLITVLITLSTLSTSATSNILINIKVPVYLWRLFNAYELIVIIGALATSFGIGLLLIFNNNGFLTLNVDDEKRKKFLNFGYVISIIIFILFLIYTAKRLSNPNDYDSLMSMQTIIEDIVLTCGVGLITISYILTEKGVRVFEVIFSVVNYVFLFLALGLFVFCIKFYIENNTVSLILFFIINSVFNLLCIVLSSISLFFGFKPKARNKILITINISSIVLSLLMFILTAFVFL